MTAFPLFADHVDTWSDRLDLRGWVSERPVLNAEVCHEFARALVGDQPYAIIETEYFGGVGEQAAAVYRAGRELMPPSVAEFGPINAALRLLGIVQGEHADEFNAVGLQRHRRFDSI